MDIYSSINHLTTTNPGNTMKILAENKKEILLGNDANVQFGYNAIDN